LWRPPAQLVVYRKQTADWKITFKSMGKPQITAVIHKFSQTRTEGPTVAVALVTLTHLSANEKSMALIEQCNTEVGGQLR